MLRRTLLEQVGLTAMLVGALTCGPAWNLNAQDEGGGDTPPAEGGGGDAGDGGGGAPAAGGGGGAPAGPVDETKVKELFREGIRQYLVGNPHDASIKLESALRMDPPADLVMYLRDEAGYDVLVDMLSQPELKHTALRIMELSKGAQMRLERSNEEIAGLVDGLKADTFDKKMEAVHQLCAVGQRAVPALIETLRDDKDPNLTATAVVTLTRMGGDAVLPLLQACRSKTPFLRQQAALVLGNIKDQRAVPELKRMLEDPAELPEVKNIAAQAIMKITGKDISSLMYAKEYYSILSDKYVMGHPSVMPSVYGDYVLWRWDTEKDAMEDPKDLPEFAYSDLLASEAARDAIALDPNYDPAWVALALAQISYGVKARISLEALADAVKRCEVDQATFDKAKADLVNANRGPFIGQLAGRCNLYRALKRALDEDKADIAVACIEALSGIADPNDLPPAQMGSDRSSGGSRMGYPLVEALINDDKRVRYAAADALVRINPERLFLGADRVIATLGDAASESSARTVLIISDDPGVRSALKVETRRLGCFPIEGVSAVDGVAKAKAYPAEDVIILDSRTANQVSFAIHIPGKAQPVVETVFDSLKADVRTRSIPIIITCDVADVDATQAMFGNRVQAYLTSVTDRKALSDALDHVLGDPEFQNRSKARAEAVSLRAAETLGWLDPANGIYNLHDAVDGLIQMLVNRPDKLKIAGAYALGRSGDTRGLSPLARGLQDANNSTDVRRACGKGMGEIYRISKADVSKDIFEVLKAALADADIGASEGAAAALANASLSAGQARDILEAAKNAMVPGSGGAAAPAPAGGGDAGGGEGN